jgi:Ca-activated chloride channel homolog
MRKVAAIILLLVPLIALFITGRTILGQILFALGFTSAYARLLDDPGWRGYELARAGDYVEAAKAFGSVRVNAYNRGNALAHAGLYRQALDAFDDALDADPEDEDARHNRTIFAKMIDSERTPPGTASGNANAVAMGEHHQGGGQQDGETNSTGTGFVGNKEGSSSASQGSSKVAKAGMGGIMATESLKASGSALRQYQS